MTPSLILAAVLLGLVVALVALLRGWRSFWDHTVTFTDWRLGTWLALLAPWPAVVAVHEFGHAVGAKLVGVTVTGIHLGWLGGSVSTGGYESPTQHWIVVVGGGLAVAAIGFTAVTLGMVAGGARPAVRQLLIVGGLVQVVSSLVVHPLVSVGTWSDWSVIYDFSATPGLSWAGGVGHAFLVLEVWRWWTRRIRWTLRAVQAGLDGHRRELMAILHQRPSDLASRLRLANLCTNLGDLRRARRLLDDTGDDDATVQLARARLALRQRRYQQALAAAAAGLETSGLNGDVRQRLLANRALALVSLDRHAEALVAFAQLESPLRDDRWLSYWRGLARTAVGDTVGGHTDLRSVAEVLPRRSVLRSHVEARLRGRRSAWRACVLDLAGRFFSHPIADWEAYLSGSPSPTTGERERESECPSAAGSQAGSVGDS